MKVKKIFTFKVINKNKEIEKQYWYLLKDDKTYLFGQSIIYLDLSRKDLNSEFNYHKYSCDINNLEAKAPNVDALKQIIQYLLIRSLK